MRFKVRTESQPTLLALASRSVDAVLGIGSAVPLVAVASEDGIDRKRIVDGEVHRHGAVATVEGIINMGIGSTDGKDIRVPSVAILCNGVENGSLTIVDGEVEDCGV